MPRNILIVVVPCAALACNGDAGLDPLSADEIEDVGQAEGDGRGTDWSGTYDTAFTSVSCDCPTVEAEMGGMTIDFDICEAVDFSPEDGTTPMVVLQTDGLLVVTIDEVGQMTGPIDSDGTFSVASHINLDSLLFDNQFLGRIDGAFSDADGVDGFEATYQQRVVANYAGQDIDCRTTFELDGTRVE